MTSRVLVADDSLTIQKVIGITLANSGYELVECLNETDLLRKIQNETFDLILLDFNLSDSHTGYDLAKQISHSMPNAAIIVMLGTFDTVDEAQFEACGITDKIVKPFESTKFIKKCRDLLEGNRPQIAIKKESPEEALFSKADDLDSWKVDAPQMHSFDSHDEEDEEAEGEEKHGTNALDPLSSEIEGWGFTPSNTLEEKFQKVFPPVIEEAVDSNIMSRLESSSQFVHTLELEDDLDATDPSFEVPEDLNRNLLSEIEDDVSADAFWAVDEIVPRKSEESEDIEDTNLDEVTADLTDVVHAFKENEKEKEHEFDFAPNYDSKIEMPSFAAHDQDALVEKLKLALRPMIEEMVKEFCRQSAEKVAWEVIPDLAENLIRKEIKEISDSVQH